MARGGNYNSTHQEAPAASPDDAITLYKQYVSIGLQAQFSLKHNAGYEETTSLAASLNRQLRDISIRLGIAIIGETVTVTVASQLPALLALKQSLSYAHSRHACTAVRRLSLWTKPPPRLHHHWRSPLLCQQIHRLRKHVNAAASYNY
jgi:hypothetical protein